MTTVKKLWLQYRSCIARTLRIPMIVTVAIFTICTAHQHIQEFIIGFDETLDVVWWAIYTYGTIITPLLAFRSWTEVFHEDVEAFSITITSEVWGGGALGVFENCAFICVLVFMLLGFLVLIGCGIIMDILDGICTIAAVFLLIVYVPMLIAAFVLHFVREYRDYKARRTASSAQQLNNADDTN